MKERVFDLEGRLIEFAVQVIRLAETLPRSLLGNHICGPLRSGCLDFAIRHSWFDILPFAFTNTPTWTTPIFLNTNIP